MRKTNKKSLSAVIVVLSIFSCSFTPNTANDMESDKVSRSNNYYDGKFHNHDDIVLAAPSYWRATKAVFFEGTDKEPSKPLPVVQLDKNQFQNKTPGNLSFVWLGHASVLLYLEGKYLLTDPMFSKRASFLQWAGPKRFHPVPIEMEDLPDLEAIVISHNHYDHLDEASIKGLDHKTKVYYVPLAVGKYLEAWGVDPKKIIELDWGEKAERNGIQFDAVPSLHFSGRGLFDQNESFWNSWVIKSRKHSIFFCGDSGMFPLFKDIGIKHGPFDLTLISNGAYSKLWHDSHLFPEEVASVHKELKGKVLLPIHWATFSLATHSWWDPAERLFKAARRENIHAIYPKIGQIVQYDNIPETPPWWRSEMAPSESE